jgi:hypothetical protein
MLVPDLSSWTLIQDRDDWSGIQSQCISKCLDSATKPALDPGSGMTFKIKGPFLVVMPVPEPGLK